MAQYQPDVMASLRTDPPVTITYDILKELLSCICCKTVKSSRMVLLKCMHFVCSNDGSSTSACLDTFKCDDGIKCPTCEIQTFYEDIAMRNFYTQEVVKFYQNLSEVWSGGSDVKVCCQGCFKKYGGESIGEACFQPCRMCDPVGLYCLAEPRCCFRTHRLRSHQQVAICNRIRFLDWEAMTNAVRTFPEFRPSSPSPQKRQRLRQQRPSTGASGGCAGAIPVLKPIPPECLPLIEIVSCEIITLLQLYNKLFRGTFDTPSELQFAGINKLRVAYTNAIYHNQILHILICGYPEDKQAWTTIQPEFSALSIFKVCRDIFPPIEVVRRNVIGADTEYETRFIIPAITQPPVHVFNGDIKEILSAPGASPRQPSPTVEISICKLEPGQPETKRQYVYEEEQDPDELLKPYIRHVKLGKCVYAYTTASSVNIAMTDESGVVLKKWKISEDGESFGRGLWWDGSRLFALLVNTKTGVYWTFEQNSAFVDRYDLASMEVNQPFEVNDSLVVQEDILCICLDPVRASQDGVIDTTLQNFIRCFDLESGISRPGIVRLMLNNPPAIKHPLLLGFQQLPHILILDRTPPGNSLVYRAPDESWNKLKLSFDDLHPVHVTDAWLEDETFLRVNYTTTAAQPEAEMAEEGYAGVAAALPPPAQQLPIKQIRINLWLTN